MSPPFNSSVSKPTEAVAPRRTMLAADEIVWPYTVLGACFGAFAIVMTIQGSHRRNQVESAVETGEPVRSSPLAQALLTGGAVLLALATTAMIIFN